MKDKYFIIWFDGYGGVEIDECNSQGECEKELDAIIGEGEEIRTVIVGKELTWKTHVSTELKDKEEEDESKSHRN